MKGYERSMKIDKDLEYAIKLCRSIGECEVGTIKKLAINRVVDELLQKCEESVAEVDNETKN